VSMNSINLSVFSLEEPSIVNEYLAPFESENSIFILGVDGFGGTGIDGRSSIIVGVISLI
jgi:hypothetical protein